MCTVQLHLLQGSPMLHLVCLHHLGSQDFQLHHFQLLLLLPMMVCASGVATQVTAVRIALRTRINWHFRQLAVETISPATATPGLMVVFMPTTLISMKLETNLLL